MKYTEITILDHLLNYHKERKYMKSKQTLNTAEEDEATSTMSNAKDIQSLKPHGSLKLPSPQMEIW